MLHTLLFLAKATGKKSQVFKIDDQVNYSLNSVNKEQKQIDSKRRLLTAGGITSLGFVGSQIARLLSNLILTRLLVPDMFGVMAIASTIMTGLSLISDTGIRQYIFWSKEGLNKDVLNTAWTMQIIRGVLICTSMLLLAFGLHTVVEIGWLKQGSAYTHPMLPTTLAALSICAIFRGFESTKGFELNRKLAMGYIVTIDVVCQLIGIVFMIALAWVYESIWALIAGSIITSLVRSTSTHIFLPGQQNSLHWDKAQFRKIFSFSRWILVSSFLGFLITHTDWFWLGALFSAETLGIYSIGKNLALVVFGLMNRLSTSVVLPELSNVAREDRENLTKSYYRIRVYIDIPAFLISGILFISGPAIVGFLYDDRYFEAGAILQVLSLLIISAGYMQAERCLVAMGHVKKRAMITGMHALGLNIAIPLFYFGFGFMGVLYAIVLSSLIPVSILNLYLWKFRVLNWIYEIRFIPLFLIGLGIGEAFNQFMIVT